MAKVSIEVGGGEGDFTIMRDGEVFSLREGEAVVLVAEDGGQMVLSGDEPIHVFRFLHETDLDDGGDDEPDEASAPVAANDICEAAPEPVAMAA